MEGRKALQRDQDRLISGLRIELQEVQRGQVPDPSLGSQQPQAVLQAGRGEAGKDLGVLQHRLSMSQVAKVWPMASWPGSAIASVAGPGLCLSLCTEHLKCCVQFWAHHCRTDTEESREGQQNWEREQNPVRNSWECSVWRKRGSGETLSLSTTA